MKEDNPLYKFYEKQYYHELDLKDRFTSKLQIFVVVFISLISLNGYLLSSAYPSGRLLFVFIIAMIVSVSSLIVACYFFIRVLSPYVYAYLPFAEGIEEYKKEIFNYYSGEEGADGTANDAVLSYLYDSYVICNTKNARNNETRSQYVFRMTWTIVICSFCSCSVFFIEKISA